MLDRHTLATSWHRWWNLDAPTVGPAWLRWALWPLVYSAVVAVGFTVMGFVVFADKASDWANWAGWAEWFGRNLIVSLAVTYAIMAAMVLGRQLLGPGRLRALIGWRRHAFFSVMALLGLAIGWPVGYWLAGGSTYWMRTLDTNATVGFLLLGLLIAAVFMLVWIARAREVAARMQATEARLALLQAQIEPHFLFNTLANVLSLIDQDAPRAKAMLESFIDYLRGALGQMREGQTSVANELALAEAYLALMAVRMADRLRYRIDSTPEARTAQLPPLLLQPLVENAIHHGLEPKVEGGTVLVRAEVVDGHLRITVQDDGLGEQALRRPGARRGTGLALANLRERLATQYGSAASLQLQPQQPGMRVVLDLPTR
jgi:signal transduction histidine kinase